MIHHILNIDDKRHREEREKEEIQRIEQEKILRQKEEMAREYREKRLDDKIKWISVVIAIAGLVSVYRDIKELWFPFLP